MADDDFSWHRFIRRPDIEQWFVTFLHNPPANLDVELDSIYVERLFDETNFMSNNPFTWLAEFGPSTPGISFENSLAAYNENPHRTAMLLREFVRNYSCERLLLLLPDSNVTVMTIRIFQTSLRDLWEDVNTPFGDYGWKLADRIFRFCIAVRLSGEPEDPFSNVMRLQNLVLQQFPTPDRALRSHVDALIQENLELKTKFISSNQITTTLAYRRLIENLCANTLVNGEVPYKTTPRWQTFWESAVNWAPYSNNHPLHALVNDQTLPQNQLRTTGRDLFGILSTNIHQYRSSEYKVDSNVWSNNVLVGRILEAMQPVNFTPTNEVNWSAEVNRY